MKRHYLLNGPTLRLQFGIPDVADAGGAKIPEENHTSDSQEHQYQGYKDYPGKRSHHRVPVLGQLFGDRLAVGFLHFARPGRGLTQRVGFRREDEVIQGDKVFGGNTFKKGVPARVDLSCIRFA